MDITKETLRDIAVNSYSRDNLFIENFLKNIVCTVCHINATNEAEELIQKWHNEAQKKYSVPGNSNISSVADDGRKRIIFRVKEPTINEWWGKERHSSKSYSAILEEYIASDLKDAGRYGQYCSRGDKFGDFRYAITAVGVEITGYLGILDTVVVPDKIENIDVTIIGSNAFRDCSHIKKVILPNTIKRIETQAFYNCVLESIVWPDNLEEIHQYAFYNGLTGNVILPDSIKKIECGAFAFCKELKSINIPGQLKTISKSLFENSGLKEIIIPSNIQNVDCNAFCNCQDLESVQLHEGLEIIGSAAFQNCDIINDIVLPSTLKKIDSSSFSFLIDCHPRCLDGSYDNRYLGWNFRNALNYKLDLIVFERSDCIEDLLKNGYIPVGEYK